MAHIKPSIREGVDWIARNDEPEETDLEAISGYISVHVLAAAFRVDSDRVARDVLRLRTKEGA